MDIGDLDKIEECYECGCLYFEHDIEEKWTRQEFLCKTCKQIQATDLELLGC